MNFQSRFGRLLTIALLAAFFISTGSTPARASGIGDYTAPFQTLVSTFENVLSELIALVEPHHAVTVELSPATLAGWHASGTTASAAAFNSVVATSQPQKPAVSPTIIHVGMALKTSVQAASVATSNADHPVSTTSAGVVLGTSTTDGVVTQSEMQAAIEQAGNTLRQLIYANAGTVGQGQYSTGGYTNNLAISQRIDSLSNVMIENPTVTGTVSGLTAASIPALSSLNGLLGIAQGGTGTSTPPAANQLLLSDANGNWEYVSTSTLGITGTGLTGTASGLSIGGNALTATALQTARNINGVSFNGSTDITVTAAAGTLTGSTLNSSVTASSLTSVGTLTSLTVASLSGILKATSGVVSAATAGTDYENPLTFNYPLTRSTNAISLAYSTTTQNFFGAYNNFSSLFATNASTTNATTTNLHVTSLANGGLAVDANGRVYSAATSTLATISGTLALTQLANQAANTLLANGTGGSAAPTAIATSSIFGTGIGGQVLAWNNGMPQWIASTTYANGAGISTAFANGQLTITNTGVTSVTQNGGTAQTGAITLATSSQTTNGDTIGLDITNSGGTFTLIPTLSGTRTVIGGGTGATSLTGLLQGNGTGAITAVSGTAGQFPYFNGTNTLNATSSIFLATSGNVGIGTNSPSYPLVVNGTTTVAQLATTGANPFVTSAGGLHEGDVVIGDPTLGATRHDPSLLFWTNAAAARLVVNNSDRFNFDDYQNTTGTGAYISGAVGGSDYFSGNVGFGLAPVSVFGGSLQTPESLIAVNDSNTSAGGGIMNLVLANTNGATSTSANIEFANKTTSGSIEGNAEIGAVFTASSAFGASGNVYPASDLVFYTGGSGGTTNQGPQERMRITSNGSVEVDDTSFVAGDANIELNAGGYINTSRTTTSIASQMQFANPNGFVGSITTTGSATAYNTSSDRRIKENIATTTAGLATLLQIPVDDFNFIKDPSLRQQGFIAQTLETIYPEAVTTNGDNGIVPLGTTSTPWEVDYGRITPLIVKSVQDIANITSTFQLNLIAWLGSASNGIDQFFANVGNFHTVNTNQLCVGSTCVTPAQFQAMVAATNPSAGSQVSISAGAPPTISGTTTPPSISVQGDNPSVLQIGDTYTDLGAIATDNEGDTLGYKTLLNGALVSNIVIDTSQVATDTIEYVATDTWGNTATSTRTIVIEADATASSTSI